jgi:hypothetical protein
VFKAPDGNIMSPDASKEASSSCLWRFEKKDYSTASVNIKELTAEAQAQALARAQAVIS